MKFEWKPLKRRDIIIALLIGVFCGCGLFLSLTATATPDNSAAILKDPENPLYLNEWMFFVRSLYLSFSKDRIKTTLSAILIAAIICIIKQFYTTNVQKLTFGIFAIIFAAAQLVSMSFKRIASWDLLVETSLNRTRAYIKGAAYALLCYYLLQLFYHLLIYFVKQDDKQPFFVKKRDFFAMMGCMFLCWLPYFVIFYPGTSNEDTVIQLMEYFEIPSYIQKMSAVQGADIFITNHHPYFLTIVFSQFVKLGLYIGDIRLGVALYTILHMLFLAAVFAGGLSYLGLCGVTKRRVRILLLILMFFPIFPLYSVCMVKDTLYASFCFIYIILMHSVARTKGEILASGRFHIALFATGFLMMLTKVYGMYILAIIEVVYLFKYRQYYKKILASIVLPILLYKFVYIGILLPALNVAPGGIQEALSVPFQQTARYVTEYGSEVTSKEKKAINQILPYKKLEKLYNPELSDPVKKRFNQESTKEDMKNYFKVWFAMFRKHPEVYVQATLNNTYQYYDINKISELEYYQFHQYLQKHDEEGEYEWLYIENLEQFAPARYVVNQFVMFLQKVPGVNLLVSMGYFPWMLLFLVLYNVFQKRRGMNIALSIPLITYAICFVSPDNGNSRYIMPIIFSLSYIFLLEMLPEDGEAAAALVEKPHGWGRSTNESRNL